MADPEVQKGRIVRIAKEMQIDSVVRFSPRAGRTWIRFIIENEATGTVLVPASGDYHSSEIADKSDDELRQFLSNLSAGRIRPSQF